MLGKWLVGVILLASLEANATAYVKLSDKDWADKGKHKKHWHQMQPGDKFGKHQFWGGKKGKRAYNPKFDTWTFDKHGGDLGKYCAPKGKPPVSAVPEAETYWLMLVGFGLYGFTQRRRWFKG